MKTYFAATLSLLCVLVSGTASAHKRWLLPTDFTLSDAETVTVDFTASNNVFYMDMPMSLAGVGVLLPSGHAGVIGNASEGARRSSFDINVANPGTHRVYVTGPAVYFLSYRLPGAAEPQRQRGTLDELRAAVPDAAQEVKFAEASALIETFITLGGASPLPPLREHRGLSLAFTSHPNELYSDATAQFSLLFAGKPLAGVELVVMPDGSRYRDAAGERSYRSDAQGGVTVSWPQPGRYLIAAEYSVPQTGNEVSMRHYSYFATVEVLAP